jgi:hypothetical protein
MIASRVGLSLRSNIVSRLSEYFASSGKESLEEVNSTAAKRSDVLTVPAA